MTAAGAAILLSDHIRTREVSDQSHGEWVELGKVVSATLKEIDAKLDDTRAGVEEQARLLERVQWDMDQFRLDNARPPKNSHARSHTHIVALRQRISALELQVAVATQELDRIRTTSKKRWWRRRLS